jgi:hypothetical protein
LERRLEVDRVLHRILELRLEGSTTAAAVSS